jgi:hypothetical protein
MKYRKKPIVIEAEQFIPATSELVSKKWGNLYKCGVFDDMTSKTGWSIETLEGKQEDYYEQKRIVNFGKGGFYLGSIYFSECNHGEGNNLYRNTHTRGAMDKDLYYIDFDFEVIGNIYQNLDLLERSKG